MDAGAPHYAAFLSYSHKDAPAARWLHRRLETYRIPKRLAGTAGEHGPVPARLTPIFRDREELPAAGDLSERVRAALSVSDHLVILCSPNSAASPWVAKEIAAFRELHPGRPLYAAIIDGDPAQCFPAILTDGGVEPLAADLRPGRDGRRLGFLKLVAGLAGVPLDALVQRDAQRRLRRVTAVTALALAAMLAMAVMTAIALSARSEAQRQRADAEGLVEFMLTDLRDKLRGVGRLDIMEAVNRRALARYGSDASGSGSPEALSRRARILHAIGEDEITLGHMDQAERVLKLAYTGTARELARDPDSAHRQFDHARSEYWLGRIHEVRREWPAAEQRYRRFAKATAALVEREPRNPDYLIEAAWSAIDLGNLQLNGLSDPAGAQHSYESAIARFQQAARLRPADVDAQRALANAYGWLADSFFMRAQWERSLAARRQQYAIMEGLHRADPAHADKAFKFAVAQRALAVSLEKVGDREAGRETLAEAYDAAGALTRSDPRNAEWQLFKGMVGCTLYFGRSGLTPRATRADVRQEIQDAENMLRATGNPRAADLARCTAALDTN
jgi:tetratricopeptide (TPR) repeat protein